MTDIDRSEALLAVMGVRPLVDKDVPYLTKAKALEATKLGQRIADMARDLCRDELEPVKLYTVDYDRTLKDLYEEWQPDQVERLVKAIEDHAEPLVVDFQAKAKSVVEYLKGIFPRSTYETFLGASNVVPNDLQIYAFESVLEVLDEPMRLFAFISQGALTKRQAAAFRLVYPTLSAAIDEALTTAAVNEKTKVASYELPPAAEVGAKPKAPGPPVPGPTTPKATVQSKEALTSSQRAAFGPTK